MVETGAGCLEEYEMYRISSSAVRIDRAQLDLKLAKKVKDKKKAFCKSISSRKEGRAWTCSSVWPWGEKAVLFVPQISLLKVVLRPPGSLGFISESVGGKQYLQGYCVYLQGRAGDLTCMFASPWD